MKNLKEGEKVNVTQNVAKYIDDLGINISELSRKSGVPYSSLYASICNKRRARELRANELTSICSVLKVNPMDFAEENTQNAEKETASTG
jgi:predicted transcriptional regulator